jgi:hypothetical protein
VKRRRKGSGVTNPSLATIFPSRFLSGLTATGSFEGWLKERKKDGDGGETGGENSGWENRWWKTGLLNLGANCSSHSQCELKGDLVSGGPGRIEPLGEDAV